MRRRIGKPSIRELVLAAVLILGLVVGVVVPGAAGDWIVTGFAAALAFVLIFRFGISHPPIDGTYRPYSDYEPSAEEREERFDHRRPGGMG
jgi:hypothetical protein